MEVIRKISEYEVEYEPQVEIPRTVVEIVKTKKDKKLFVRAFLNVENGGEWFSPISEKKAKNIIALKDYEAQEQLLEYAYNYNF